MQEKWETAYQESKRCIRCGYCQPTCPTFTITGIEDSVARGRNYITRIIHEGEIELSRDYKDTIFECLLCGACVENCAPAVKTPQIMMAVRNQYIQKNGQPYLQKFVFNELLPNPERFTRLMKLASLGKRSGISGLAQALRVFGWFGKNIANMENLLKSLPAKFLKERLDEVRLKNQDKNLKVGYFVGCGINYAFPDMGLATINLLTKNDYTVEILDNYCCGLPAAGYGDLNAARNVAQKNIELFEKSGCDIILSECASCSSFLTEYPDLFEVDEHWRERAEKISEKIIDINTFLTKFKIKTEFKSNEELVVTYHDPCHLSHYLKITEEPRKLINQIAGIKLDELPEANWCCGGAGTYNIAHYELSMKILQRKMNNLEKTEASVLLSSCPGCQVQLSYGVRKFNKSVQVMHIVQLLNNSII